MTPKELCDLAQRINAAVPGLVPDIEMRAGTIGCVHVTGCAMEPELAAAMMLGRCEAWLRVVPQLKDPSVNVVLAIADIGDVMSAYVATTLPGAKA